MRYLILFLFALAACAHAPAAPQEEPARFVGESEVPMFTGAIHEAPAEPLPDTSE